MNNVLFSSNSDNWKTPSILYKFFLDKGFRDLFPYCSTVDQYGIKYRKERLFINPPYSHLNSKQFIDYINDLLLSFNTIVLLIPCRTDTKVFQHLLNLSYYVYFFKGRLHFNDSKQPAPFPSCLIFLNLVKFTSNYFECGTIEDFINKYGSI